MDLPLFYFLLLGFAILMYVLLDGFDLGIGILYPWIRDEADKDQHQDDQPQWRHRKHDEHQPEALHLDHHNR